MMSWLLSRKYGVTTQFSESVEVQNKIGALLFFPIFVEILADVNFIALILSLN